ncbi:MAG: DMT family transporter [Bacteroidota bacterium]|nr:DMT family transporter [Bacteroidota bacterium]
MAFRSQLINNMGHLGEIAALITAMCWTVTAMAFSSASNRVGSLAVNLLRLVAGFFFLSIFCWISRGMFFPADASGRTWFYLLFSGLVGFTFGDLCLFQAFVVIGARISMLLMALSPPMAAIIGWMIMGEKMSFQGVLGMLVTLAGVSLVVLKREPGKKNEKIGHKIKLSYPFWGIMLGLGGALGQGAGLVLSKFGMGNYDPFAASQIRVMAGIAGFSVVFTFWKKWREVFHAFTDKKALGQLTLGAFFGPFLGVSFSLMAVQHTNTGIASTIMAIVPVLIIPPSILIFKEKVTLREIIGAVVAVGGVALFFL